VRVGLLGGTFNPPHLGHLVCASFAIDGLGLDRVELVPVHTPPHKEAVEDPGVEHRMAMCAEAVGADPRLAVSRAEADVPGRSYTVDTLSRLHEQRPEDQLTFIVGGDMAHSLPDWRGPEAILSLAEIGVAGRADLDEQTIRRSLEGLAGAAHRVRFFDMPRIDISSTLVRNRVAAGHSVRYLVPDAVAGYIERNALYTAARTEPAPTRTESAPNSERPA
jgi:nicotinate-nucleotide adenylyltransferase